MLFISARVPTVTGVSTPKIERWRDGREQNDKNSPLGKQSATSDAARRDEDVEESLSDWEKEFLESRSLL